MNRSHNTASTSRANPAPTIMSESRAFCLRRVYGFKLITLHGHRSASCIEALAVAGGRSALGAKDAAPERRSRRIDLVEQRIRTNRTPEAKA